MDNHVLEDKILQKVMMNIPLGLVVCKGGAQKKVYYVNSLAYEMLGYTRQEYMRLLEGGWHKFMGLDLDTVMNEKFRGCTEGEPFEITAPVHAKDGSLKWLLIRVIVRMESEPIYYISMMDMTQQIELFRKQEQEQEYLRECASRDSFTRLLNRGTMEDLIKDKLNEENNGRHHAYIALDLDDFKQINDIYGHCVGDGLILELSNILTEQFGERAYIARMGGDEFAVFVADIDDKTYIEHCGKHILSDLRGRKRDIGLNEEPSVSIGIAFYPEAGTSFEELYHRADEALYSVKKKTKNGVAVAK